MASACSRIAQRTSLSSIKSAIKFSVSACSFSRSAATISATSTKSSSTLRRFFLTRIASELGCLHSMMPLHSAVAAARMTSCLSTSSMSFRALCQGTWSSGDLRNLPTMAYWILPHYQKILHLIAVQV